MYIYIYQPLVLSGLIFAAYPLSSMQIGYMLGKPENSDVCNVHNRFLLFFFFCLRNCIPGVCILVTNLKQNESQSAHAESKHKGVHKRSKSVTQVQQQRPESPTVTFTWHACKYKVQKLHPTPLVSLCTLYLHTCQVKVTVGDSGLCCCTCVTYFERINSLVC